MEVVEVQKIRIIKSNKHNWYKVGDEYTIKDAHSYQPLGIQVFKENNGKSPDVVENGHFEYIR